ncbi:MAG: hypothetical protein ACLPN5_22165 [Roseiarcus sp.]
MTASFRIGPLVALGLAALPAAVAAEAQQAAPLCQLDPRAAPDRIFYVEATVIGPAPDADVMSQTRIAILRTRAPESPAYAKLPRIDAAYQIGGVTHMTIAAVLDGPLPKPGERVRLASRHRDPTQPCAFVPWTVVKPGERV